MGTVFTRRQNRGTSFNAEIVTQKFLNNTKLNEDYSMKEKPFLVKNVLNSKLFCFVFKSNYTSPFVLLSFINSIIVPNEITEHSSDFEIYQHFNLTQEEIKYIEENDK